MCKILPIYSLKFSARNEPNNAFNSTRLSALLINLVTFPAGCVVLAAGLIQAL